METLDDLIAALDVTEGQFLPLTYHKTLTVNCARVAITVKFKHYADTGKLYGLELFISDDWCGELSRFIYFSGSYEKLHEQYLSTVERYTNLLKAM